MTSRSVWTRVSLQLPFLIPVDDAVYEVVLRKKKSRIRTQRVQKLRLGLLQIQPDQSADLKYDTRGTLSSTNVSIDLMGRLDTMSRRKDQFFDSERFVVVEEALEYLNKFIDSIKQVTGIFSVPRLVYTDVLNVDFSYVENGENPVGKLMTTGTGSLGITQGRIQYLSEEQNRTLTQLLSIEAGFRLSNSFLMDSKASLLAEDYYLATVLAVVGLEVALSEFMRARAKKAGVNDNDLEEMIKNVGLKGGLGVITLFLRPEEPKPDSNLISDSRGAITVRNDIIHRGLRTVPRSETVKRIPAIETMISYLEALDRTA